MTRRRDDVAVPPTEVIPAPQRRVTAVTIVPPAGCPLADCPTNLDLSTPRGQALALAARGECDLDVAGLAGAVWETRWWLVDCVQSEDEETGELHEYPRLVLIRPDGKTLVTTSQVAPRRMADIISLYGPGPWDPSLRITIVDRRSRRSGRMYHDLKLEVPNEAEPCE